MASLRSPLPRLTLPEITAGYLELEQGGASLMVCEEEQAFLGVLPAAARCSPTHQEAGDRAARAVRRGASRRATPQPEPRRR